MKRLSAKSATHSVLIMDQSPAGQKYANQLAAGWAPVEERLSRWRASKDALLVFFLEQWEGGRAGSMTAKDVDHLLSDVLTTTDAPGHARFWCCCQGGGSHLDGNRAAESCCFGFVGTAALTAAKLGVWSSSFQSATVCRS